MCACEPDSERVCLRVGVRVNVAMCVDVKLSAQYGVSVLPLSIELMGKTAIQCCTIFRLLPSLHCIVIYVLLKITDSLLTVIVPELSSVVLLSETFVKEAEELPCNSMTCLSSSAMRFDCSLAWAYNDVRCSIVMSATPASFFLF